jgi:hypothetical protein
MAGEGNEQNRPLTAAQALARLRAVDSEFLHTGDERHAVAAHELSTNPHRQYTTTDQAQQLAAAAAATRTAAHETSPNPHQQYVRADQAVLFAAFFS